MFFGTLAAINGHRRSRTDIGGLRRTLTDKDGHMWTCTDIGGLGRTRVAKGRPAAGLPFATRVPLCYAISEGRPPAFRDRITKGNPCPPMSCPFLDSIRQRTCFWFISKTKFLVKQNFYLPQNNQYIFNIIIHL